MSDKQDSLRSSDEVTNPAHYKLFGGQYEVRDLIADRLEAVLKSHRIPPEVLPRVLYDLTNFYKYSNRWQDKNGLVDLKKAQECLGKVIKIMESVDGIRVSGVPYKVPVESLVNVVREY